MGVHSGKFGAVQGIPSISSWNMSESGSNATTYASNTYAAALRKKGIKVVTGGYTSHAASPTLMPGEVGTFLGYTAPTNDVTGTGQTYSLSAAIDALTVNWDFSAGGFISHDVTFTGAGVLTKGTADITDATAPTFFESCNSFGIEIENVTQTIVSTAIPNVASASLSITAANPQHTDSTTSCSTWAKGGPISWAMSITVNNDITSTHNIGDLVIINGYLDDTDFWDINWFRVTGFTGLVVNLSGEIIQHTIELEGTSADDATPSQGRIWRPGETVSGWWGV